jgi:hypothetical protein
MFISLSAIGYQQQLHYPWIGAPLVSSSVDGQKIPLPSVDGQ